MILQKTEPLMSKAQANFKDLLEAAVNVLLIIMLHMEWCILTTD